MSTATPFTADDLELLRRPLHGFFVAAAGSTPPQPRPIWFEADDDVIRFFSETDAAKVRRLRRDPRATIVVAAPVGERERWVSVTGEVTIDPDADTAPLVRRTAARYWDLDDPARQGDLGALLALDQVLLVLHPGKVSRFAY